MQTRKSKLLFFLIFSIFSVICTSCSSSASIVVSSGADLSKYKYKYVVFGKESTGDGELSDIIMLVENEISNTKLQPISLRYAPDDYLEYTLTPDIHVTSEKWDGGYTYITITFSDIFTGQNVAVIKSRGIGLTVSHDQKLALNAIREKLQNIFGKKDN